MSNIRITGDAGSPVITREPTSAPLIDPPVRHFLSGRDRQNEDLTEWNQVTRGQALGKRIVFEYDPDADVAQYAPIECLQLSLPSAVQMRIVLASPTVVPLAAGDLDGIDLQNLTNEHFNSTIGADDFPGAGAPIIWPPFTALVEWGTNGRSHAQVDWRNGAPINISASWVRVRAMVAADAASVPGTAAAYVLGAFASPGWADGDTAGRTVFLGAVTASDESDVFDVPPLARTATVIGMTNGVVTAAYINFWRSPDGTHPCGTYFQSGNTPGEFRVPNGAQYFSINPEATGPYCVVFDLSL